MRGFGSAQACMSISTNCAWAVLLSIARMASPPALGVGELRASPMFYSSTSSARLSYLLS